MISIKKYIFALIALSFSLASFSFAQTINNGDLIRENGTLDIYIVKLIGTKKFKRLILNPAIFESYGHLRWEDVIDAPRSTVDGYVTSNLVIEVNADGSVADPRVFLILSSENSDVGERHGLDISAEKFESLGFDWDGIYHINRIEASPNFYPDRGTFTTDEVISPWAKGMKDALQNQARAAKEAQEQIIVSIPPPEDTVANPDLCANALGNGDQIISGPSGPEGGDRDNPFHSLAVHPTNPNHIFVGTERNGFLRSLDGGVTWERLRYGLQHSGGGYPEIYDIAIAESNPSVIYAATVDSPGPLTREGATSGVYKSTDGGKTWERKNCGIQDNGGRVTSIYVDPNNHNHAFIGISGGEISYYTADQPAGRYIDGGVYETINGGDSWTLLNIAPNDRKQELRVFRSPSSNKNTIYAVGLNFSDYPAIGFVKSTDSGKTWQQIGTSVKDNIEGSFDVSSDGNTIYTQSNEYKIYKSTDSGATWSSHDVIRTSGYTLTVSPVDSERVIFGQTNGLFLSTNGLLTVTKVLNIDENSGRISDLVFAPSNPTIVYMITQGYVFYKSTDAGVTFIQLGNLRNDVLNKSQ